MILNEMISLITDFAVNVIEETPTKAVGSSVASGVVNSNDSESVSLTSSEVSTSLSSTGVTGKFSFNFYFKP